MSASRSASSSKLLVNKIYTQDQLRMKVDGVCDEAMQLFSFDPDLCHHIDTLRNYGHEMISFMHEYDINPNIQANGYRSLLQAGIDLMKYGIKTYKDTNYNNNIVDSPFIRDFKKLIANFVAGIKYVKRLREESIKLGTMRDVENNIYHDLASSPELLVDFFYDYINSDEARQIYFSRHSFLGMSPFMKFAMSSSFVFTSLRHSTDLISSFRCLFDSEYRRKIMTQVRKYFVIFLMREKMFQYIFNAGKNIPFLIDVNFFISVYFFHSSIF